MVDGLYATAGPLFDREPVPVQVIEQHAAGVQLLPLACIRQVWKLIEGFQSEGFRGLVGGQASRGRKGACGFHARAGALWQ